MRDKSYEIEKPKRKEITITKTRKKTEKGRKKRKAVRISMKSVRRGAICLRRVRFKKKEVLKLEKKKDGVTDDKSGED